MYECRSECRSSSSGSPAASRAASNASFAARSDIRPRGSVTHNAGCLPGTNSAHLVQVLVEHPDHQFISGTVNTVRRLGGLPRDAVPVDPLSDWPEPADVGRPIEPCTGSE